MKDSAIKKLERVKELTEKIDKIKYRMKYGFDQSSRSHMLSSYDMTDKLKENFISTQSKYKLMVDESIEKFKTYSIQAKYILKASECYESLLKLEDECNKEHIYVPDPNLYFIDKFADREFIYNRLVNFLKKSCNEFNRIAQEEIAELEHELEELLLVKTEVVKVKSDYLKNIATLAGYEGKDRSYSFKDDDKNITVIKGSDNNGFKLLIEGSKKSYSIEFPEVLAYSGLYEFLCKSKSIKSLDTLLSSVKFYGVTKFDEYLSKYIE